MISSPHLFYKIVMRIKLNSKCASAFPICIVFARILFIVKCIYIMFELVAKLKTIFYNIFMFTETCNRRNRGAASIFNIKLEYDKSSANLLIPF